MKSHEEIVAALKEELEARLEDGAVLVEAPLFPDRPERWRPDVSVWRGGSPVLVAEVLSDQDELRSRTRDLGGYVMMGLECWVVYRDKQRIDQYLPTKEVLGDVRIEELVVRSEVLGVEVSVPALFRAKR